MRKNSAGILFFLVMTGCDRNRPSPNPSALQGTNRESGCGNTPCEVTAYMKRINPPSGGTNGSSKIKLSVPEQSSLSGALAAARTAGPSDGTHIHADAKNGQLVFSMDNASDRTSASHVSGTEPEISLTERGTAKKVVVTAAANELLQKRVVR
jgi:hypothetical protein